MKRTGGCGEGLLFGQSRRWCYQLKRQPSNRSGYLELSFPMVVYDRELDPTAAKQQSLQGRQGEPHGLRFALLGRWK